MMQKTLFDEIEQTACTRAQQETSNSTRNFPIFPTTRYQGSKRKILRELSTALSTLKFESVLDLFSGSGIVSLLFRFLGKHVQANDYQLYAKGVAQLFLKLGPYFPGPDEISHDLNCLLVDMPLHSEPLVSNNFSGVYFTDLENLQIDRFCQNIGTMSELKQALYVYAIGQALLKKRPYNLFHRANLCMRTKDVPRSFGNAATWETPTAEHAIKALVELSKFPFRSLRNDGFSTGINTSNLDAFEDHYDLIYLDPPYLNSSGQAIDYSDFYNFLEGLCDYRLYSNGDPKYPHKPIAKKNSNWSSIDGAVGELEAICMKWPDSTIFLSYRSDGKLTPEAAKDALSINQRGVEIHTCGEYKYALSKTSRNEELFIVSRP
jgi:adenine-specific DNA-methyltransferase